MKLYMIEAPGATRFAGSQTEARARRDELVAQGGFKKKDVTTTPYEVATGKAGIIAALNGVCEKLESA